MIKYIPFYFATLFIISCNNTSKDEIKSLQEKIIEQNAILEKQRKELTNETISHEKINKNETYPSQDLTSNSYKTKNKYRSTNSNYDGEYPEASTSYLSSEQLKYLSPFELKIMRNEIFARHGYIFKTPEMKNYFNTQNWYYGRFTNVDNQLTQIEKENIQLIKSYE
jgi:hypothetical protein